MTLKGRRAFWRGIVSTATMQKFGDAATLVDILEILSDGLPHTAAELADACPYSRASNKKALISRHIYLINETLKDSGTRILCVYSSRNRIVDGKAKGGFAYQWVRRIGGAE